MVFKFTTAADWDGVLVKGPYSIYGRPLILQPLPPRFGFADDGFSKVPVWTQLHNLPLECCTRTGISGIATLIGDPMAMDINTVAMSRISFALVLIEMDPMNDVLDAITVAAPNGESFEVKIKYENLLRYCKFCNKIGHDINGCRVARRNKSGNNHLKNEKLATASVLAAPLNKDQRYEKNEAAATEAFDICPPPTTMQDLEKEAAIMKDQVPNMELQQVKEIRSGKEIMADPVPLTCLEFFSDDDILEEDAAAWQQLEEVKAKQQGVGHSRPNTRSRSRNRGTTEPLSLMNDPINLPMQHAALEGESSVSRRSKSRGRSLSVHRGLDTNPSSSNATAMVPPSASQNVKENVAALGSGKKKAQD